MILKTYGSTVNGLVNSISQYLGVISFLELGVGSVVQSALYKPLLENNISKINDIVVSAHHFFRQIAKALIIYSIVLTIVFPIIVKGLFSPFYISTLIFSMVINYFAQYYFGIVDRLLLYADQKSYIYFFTHSLVIIINTAICYFLIMFNYSIQIVKLFTSLIYLIYSYIIHIYVVNSYKYNLSITPEKDPLPQKWNGIAQHVSAIVLDNVDIIVLTIFATLDEISIYSVYYLVIKGIKQLLISLTSGIRPLFGNMYANNEKDELSKVFRKVEWAMHSLTVFVFGVTAASINQFIQVYTYGINDINYIKYYFSLFLTVANGLYCLRLPYNSLILAAGHYKQTQSNYIIASILNIIFSIIFVLLFGFVGVVFGTIIAMVYQIVWMYEYDRKHILQINKYKSIYQFISDCVIFMLIVIIGKTITFDTISYASWIVFAIKISLLSIIISAIVNLLFNFKEFCYLIKKSKKL